MSKANARAALKLVTSGLTISELRELHDAIEDRLGVGGGFFDDLYNAICEGRQQDAIDIINDRAPDHYRDIRAQHRLFPDRVVNLNG